MGSSKDIDKKNGGFHTYKYTSNESINGIKIVEKKPEYKNGLDEPPPSQSGRSKEYFGKDRFGRVDSLKVYDENRDSSYEIHTHPEPGNSVGTVHYHEYHKDKNGKIVRDRKGSGKPLTPALIQKHGPSLERARQRNVEHGINDPTVNYNFTLNKEKK